MIHTFDNRLWILYVLFLLPPCLAHASTNSDEGLVLNLRGDWKIQGQQQLIRVGQSVPGGALLVTDWYKYGNSITVVLFDGDNRKLECMCQEGSDNPCREGHGLLVPTESVGRRDFHEIITAVMSELLEKGPQTPKYAETSARGASGVLLGEIVNPARSPIPLAGELATLPTGTYSVNIHAVNQNNSASHSTINWDPRVRQPQSIGPLGPGLYDVEFVTVSNEAVADFWLYACKPARCTTATSSLRNARKLVDGWGEKPPDASAHLLMRCYLSALEEETEKQK